ncbi:MAG: PAS domain S-box protein [Emcibacteraceae bacterium]|nr:PAS domain S-box protein [Emcibacteraceae bacterium]
MIASKKQISNRIASYVMTSVFFCILFYLSRGSNWLGNGELHTIMEVVATLLAFIVGIMALVRYYSKKNSTLLIIGAGFIGTAMLDGYHAVVTSSAFAPFLPSDLPALIPWSWVASRFFLAMMVFLSWAVWRLKLDNKMQNHIKERTVYSLVTVLTVISFLFFAFFPLPRAYYPEYIFGRPEEFLPAILFIFALIGYWKKGKWKHDVFEHWIVIALIVSVVSQLLFMPFSFVLFDFDFDMAHFLKKVTYVLFMIGLLFSMYVTFKQSEENIIKLAVSNKDLASVNRDLEQTILKRIRAERLSIVNANKFETIFKTVPDGIITTDEKGDILAFNHGSENIFGYKADEVIGKNVKVLMPHKFAQHHDKYVNNFENGQGVMAIGKRRDLLGLRKDGQTFDMDLTINDNKSTDDRIIITGIVRDITKEKQSAYKLSQSIIDLAKSNEELEQFAYIASHDLKAPLRGIDNLAKFIKEDIGEDIDEDTLQNFDLMQNRIQRMEKLLDDLLNYSKVGRTSSAFEDVDINELLDNIKTLISPPDGFEIHISGGTYSINTLEAPFQQALTNVINNAIKHHDKENGVISVNIEEEGKFIKFTITDDGPGIPQEFHKQIFKMFQTLKPRDEVEGSGIGLAVVKKTVDAFGGSIKVFSTDGQRGTKFEIMWPKIIKKRGHYE